MLAFDVVKSISSDEDEIVAQWIRKARYEAVIADRKTRTADGETTVEKQEGCGSPRSSCKR